MAAKTPYAIGTEVHCTDQSCGRLTRVVIDPVGLELTHLVVEPERDPGRARLVPVALVDQGTDAEGIRLRCDAAGFALLEAAVQTGFLPGSENQLGYPADQSVRLPYFPLGPAGGAAMAPGVLGSALPPEPQAVTYDRLPAGEVLVRRGQPVHATDGEIGKVQGLVIDPRDHQITHVLLQEGHLWGKKQVALPIRDVTEVYQGVHLDLSKDQVHALPPVDVEQLV